jgi:hypothetical protein
MERMTTSPFFFIAFLYYYMLPVNKPWDNIKIRIIHILLQNPQQKYIRKINPIRI